MTIPISDLRIGNYVAYGDSDYPDKLSLGFFWRLMRKEEERTPIALRGVPIREDILLASGFKTNGFKYPEYSINSSHDYFAIELLIDGPGYQFKYYQEETTFERGQQPMLYVHQLQNLFHSLYGEELKIVFPEIEAKKNLIGKPH